MKAVFKLFAVFSVMLFLANSVYAGKKDPVAVLFQVKGKVEYTKNGKKWKKVRRNKFLFAGYQIRTTANGSGKITIQKTGKNLVLGPNSLIEVTNSGLVAQNGTLEGSESSSRLVSGLMKRFTKSQSYTTVRRSAKSNGISIDAVRKITLSDAHPDLVWNNCGAKYRYQLTVGEDVYDVPATQDRVIRVSIRPFAGTRPFKISVFEGDTTITAMEQYKSRGKLKDRTIVWLSGGKSTKIETTVAEIQQTYGEDSFMLGSFFEKENIWVAAMDQYKLYLRENPDEIEMTPYLFRVYKKLKLSAVYKSELAAWTDAMNE